MRDYVVIRDPHENTGRSNAPTKTYRDDLGGAETEAMRLAEKNPGVKFYVAFFVSVASLKADLSRLAEYSDDEVPF